MEIGEYDNALASSGRNPLIPRSQVLDVLKNLSIKEGLFNEEELKQLENGYSVSESDDVSSKSSLMEQSPMALMSEASHAQMHYNQQSNQMHLLKAKYTKKLTALERLLDQQKAEKREL